MMPEGVSTKSRYVQIAAQNIVFTSSYSISAQDDNHVDNVDDEPELLADELDMRGAGHIIIKDHNGSIKCIHKTDVDENVQASNLPQGKNKPCTLNNVEAKNRQREVRVDHAQSLK